jgi:hypothetical protein
VTFILVQGVHLDFAGKFRWTEPLAFYHRRRGDFNSPGTRGCLVADIAPKAIQDWWPAVNDPQELAQVVRTVPNDFFVNLLDMSTARLEPKLSCSVG